MVYNKYHVILDTTNLFTSEFKIINLNEPVIDFKMFVDKYGENKILVYIPEIVRDERIEQNSRIFQKHKENIIKYYKKITETGLKLDLTELERFNYKKEIIDKLNKSIKEKRLKLIKSPKVDSKVLFKRFFECKKPFIDAATEKGFKDTYIWLSVTDFSKNKTQDKIIFITQNNKDFTSDLKKEFKTLFKSEIEIFYNFESAKEYIDTEFNLNLQLKKQYCMIERIVFENIGEIMNKINSNKDMLDSMCLTYITSCDIRNDKKYDYLIFSNNKYIDNISDDGLNTIAKLHFKLRGNYHRFDEMDYTFKTPILTLPDRLGFINFKEKIDYIGNRYFKNIDAEIDISIDNNTEELKVRDIRMEESMIEDENKSQRN